MMSNFIGSAEDSSQMHLMARHYSFDFFLLRVNAGARKAPAATPRSASA